MSTTVVVIGDRQAVEVEVGTLVLEATSGPDAGLLEVFDSTPVVIGSGEDADLRLTDPAVSRRHCELLETPGGVRIRDLGSTNGTFFAGAKITDVLLEGDGEFKVGGTALRLELRADSRVAFVAVDPGAGAGADDGGMIGAAPDFLAFKAAVAAAAPARANVMLFGESGTGKELAARALHDEGGRAGELVVYDCSTADPTLLRSDLFGHKKGAFTGADADRPGAVRAADKGTLFLDEIGELPLDLQAHLLRVLEAREVKPLGADKAVPIDVRVVAATHRDLGEMVREGKFRLDLYHRLSVVVLRVPPLRERLADLEALVGALARRLKVRVSFAPDAWTAMRAHPWPGNIRELRNVIERAAIVAAGRPATAADLQLTLHSPGLAPAAPADPAPQGLRSAAKAGEKQAIEEALRASGGVRTKAAEALGISVATLWRRMKKYSIEG